MAASSLEKFVITPEDLGDLPAAEGLINTESFDEKNLAVGIRDLKTNKLRAAAFFHYAADEAILRYYYDDGVVHPTEGTTVFERLFKTCVQYLKKKGIRSIYARIVGTWSYVRDANEVLIDVHFLPVHLVGQVICYSLGDIFDTSFYRRAMPMLTATSEVSYANSATLTRTPDETVILRIPESEDRLSELVFREHFASLLAYATNGQSLDLQIYIETTTKKSYDRITRLFGEAEEQYYQEYLFIIK